MYDRVELGKIASIRNENIKNNQNIEYLYISTANMNPDKGGIDFSETDSYGKSGKRFYRGDILVSNIRPYFKKIWYATSDGICSNDILRYVPKDELKLDKKFLYYVLSDSQFFDYMTATAKGTKMPRGDKNAIEKYLIPDITHEEQQNIVNVLSCLDKKIENNNAIIANLEEQAQTIFKSWFVDFEPFQDEKFIGSELGQIPENWVCVPLEELSDIIMGQSPKSEFYNTENKGMKFMQGNTTFGDKFGEIEKYTTQANRVADLKDILLSVRAPVGDMNINIFNDLAIGRGLTAIKPPQEIHGYVYYYLKHNINRLVSRGSGTVFSSINKKDLTTFPILLPQPNKYFYKFNDLTSSILDYQLNIFRANKALTETRDTLLPKLMSGEIRVDA